MPNDRQISHLLELLERDLCVESLDCLTAECYALARDRAPSLPFFVIAAVCERLSDALEREPTEFSRWQEITAGIREKMLAVVLELQERVDVAGTLEDLVQTMLRNTGRARET